MKEVGFSTERNIFRVGNQMLKNLLQKTMFVVFLLSTSFVSAASAEAWNEAGFASPAFLKCHARGDPACKVEGAYMLDNGRIIRSGIEKFDTATFSTVTNGYRIERIQDKNGRWVRGEWYVTYGDIPYGASHPGYVAGVEFFRLAREKQKTKLLADANN